MMEDTESAERISGTVEAADGSALGIEEDPLSFESTASDYLTLTGVPKEKQAKAMKALKAAIMACMPEMYP